MEFRSVVGLSLSRSNGRTGIESVWIHNKAAEEYVHQT